MNPSGFLLSCYRLKQKDMTKIQEIWKDVVGYEGLYQVSNIGRVKSLDRTVNLPDRKKQQGL